ncbi:hypothetical protein [Kitasatospora sp. LaBMicrA B282]|uniref:hypothetical protein n=1 Tax=Kitasatospora sp. LaBMicrA B282 TaxID=3420949 RepID=UPI003D0B5EF8
MIAGPAFWDAEIAAAGWTRVTSPPPAMFPETVARPSAWGRNFYTRGGQRLVMEWSDPVTLTAVLMNGLVQPVETAEDLAALIRRTG